MITPEDIDARQFPVKVRGYSQDDVDDFLDEVSADYRKTLEELYRVRGEQAGVSDAVAILSSAQRTHDQTVLEANTTAGRIIAQAEREASRIVADAQEKGHAVIGELEATRRSLKAEIGLLRSVRLEAADRMRKCLDSMGER